MSTNPTLYILMRDDLDSLNPGKAIAQATHATNQFELLVASWQDAEGPSSSAIRIAVNQWREDRDFGRCLTVAAKPHQIEEIMSRLDDGSRFLGDMVVDPTYPISDGEVVHHIELMTCGWVFMWEDDHMDGPDWNVRSKIKKLSLYK